MARIVPDDGRRSARLVLVGEAPGEWETRLGRPFVGPSGRRLDEWWETVGLSRSDFYVTNTVPYQPVGNRIETVPPLELQDHVEALHDRIAELDDPIVIVPTGAVALQALTQKQGILKHRGSIYSYLDRRGRTVKVIPTIHPAATFRTSYWQKRCVADWKRIAGDSQFTELRIPEREHYIRPTLDDVKWFAERALASGEPLSIDIETPRRATWTPTVLKSGKPGKPKRLLGYPYIACVGFSHDAGVGMCIPTTLEYWKSRTRVDEVWGIVKRLCASRLPKIGQNFLFDRWWLTRYGVRVANVQYDTMAMHHAVDANEDHDLAYLGSRYTRQPYWKDEAKDPDEIQKYASDLDAFWTYNSIDATTTREIADALDIELGDKREFYLRHYRDAFGPLLHIMLTGVRVDEHARRERAGALEAEIAHARAALTKLVGVDLYGDRSISPQKLAAYLFGLPLAARCDECKGKRRDKYTCGTCDGSRKLSRPLPTALRLPKQLNRKTQSVTTSEVTIRKLMLRYPEKLADAGALILGTRRNQQLSTFVAEKRVSADGRSYSSYSFSPECFTGDTEILTRAGWQRIDNVDDRLVAAVWSFDDRSIHFENVKRVAFAYNGPVYKVANKRHPMIYTPGHRLPIVRYQPLRCETRKTGEPFPALFQFMASGLYTGSYSCSWIRLLVAAQADGSLGDGGIAFNLKRPRKIKRLRALCRELGVNLIDRKTQNGFARLYIPAAESKDIINLIGSRREFGAWLLNFDDVTLDAFLEELRWWDGSAGRSGATVYTSTSLQSIKWVQTIAHLRGRTANVLVKREAGEPSFGKYKSSKCWIVRICRVGHRQGRKTDFKLTKYHGPVWCLKTSTGFFLVRRNGAIMVTGNTGRLSSSRCPDRSGQNAQNVDREIRGVFVPDPGCVFVEVDESQGESRIVGVLSRDPFLVERARTAPGEIDEHREIASAIFGIREDAVSKSQRYIGKRVNHASAYGMHGKKLAEELSKDGYTLTGDECERMIQTVLARKPAVIDWQRRVRQQVLRTRRLTNNWGRTISFDYERFDDDLYRRAYAWVPQGSLADLLNQYGMIPLWRWIVRGRLPVRINANVHDSLLVSTPIELAYDVAEFLVRSLERPRVYDGIELTIPVEAKVGLVWGSGVEFKRLPTREKFYAALHEGGITVEEGTDDKRRERARARVAV